MIYGCGVKLEIELVKDLERSISDFRLVREHVSGEDGGRKYIVYGCLVQSHGSEEIF